MRTPKVFIARDRIQDAVRRLAEEIRPDYRNTVPLLLSTLNLHFAGYTPAPPGSRPD